SRHRVDLIEFLAQSVDHKHPMPVFFNRPLVGIHQTMGTYTLKVKRFGLCAPAVMPLYLPAMGNALKQFFSVATGKGCETNSTPVFKFMPEEEE
ncbi:hypothetical protein ACFFJN_01090, partial [Erwinia mallotivora]